MLSFLPFETDILSFFGSTVFKISFCSFFASCSLRSWYSPSSALTFTLPFLSTVTGFVTRIFLPFSTFTSVSFLPASRSSAFVSTVYSTFPLVSFTVCVIVRSVVPAASVICFTTVAEIVVFTVSLFPVLTVFSTAASAVAIFPSASFVTVTLAEVFFAAFSISDLVVVEATVPSEFLTVVTSCLTVFPLSFFIVSVFVSVVVCSGFVSGVGAGAGVTVEPPPVEPPEDPPPVFPLSLLSLSV